ncbi:phosphatase PAP2 family protein [Cytophagaceae bacterium DM2B3-1]|uniref:Phosphatase PAP2 family protein n=1 Tax=Xanthocytophaga flava TaxID=3048013 RepID=A0ABT7CWT8_9BACT|nr:phosphatase PAP2 family protein [Xanthocytophaga flavus]MDJ1498116.1 phosphatase PAP2 family protein [Xanthocytophaga flavus]
MKKIVGVNLLMYACVGIIQISGQSLELKDTVYQDESVAGVHSRISLNQTSELLTDQAYSLSDNYSLKRTPASWFTTAEPTQKTESNSPYVIHPVREIGFLTSSVVLSGMALVAKNKEGAITASQLACLQRESIWTVDRGATYHYSSSAHKASNVLLYSSVMSPWLYLAGEKTCKDFGKISLMHAETFMICWGITGLTKAMVFRPRPYVYNPHVSNEVKLTQAGRESFFSGHVAMTAAMSFFTASTFSHYYPDSKWKPLVWSYAVVWPAATGYYRYKAGKHFVSDIVIGYAIGAATGLLVPKLHEKIAGKRKKTIPSSNPVLAKVAWQHTSQ